MNMLAVPKLAIARSVADLSPGGGNVDIDLLHAMDQRDEALVADEILHGSMTGKFVYNFEIQGTQVTGVSVIGARHLMYHYKGLKHRLVASTLKRGPLFIFTTYPSDYGAQMGVNVNNIEAMGEEPDFYQALCEITDTKTGNSLQRERIEMRYERRRDGTYYERPNFQTIAQSKAFRNAILDLLPQDVVLAFKAEAMKLGKTENITENVIEIKRRNVMQFAAARGIGIDRSAIGQLGWDQINGLSEAARTGEPSFIRSCAAVGILQARTVEEEPATQLPPPGQAPPQPQPTGARGGRRRQETKEPPQDPAPPPGSAEDYGQASTPQTQPSQPPTGETQPQGQTAEEATGSAGEQPRQPAEKRQLFT